MTCDMTHVKHDIFIVKSILLNINQLFSNNSNHSLTYIYLFSILYNIYVYMTYDIRHDMSCDMTFDMTDMTCDMLCNKTRLDRTCLTQINE